VDTSLAEYDMKKQNGELGIHDQRNYDGLQKLQNALDKADGTDDKNKKLYVLGIDTKHDGRAVVSQGNPGHRPQRCHTGSWYRQRLGERR
jgi:hypothetical protein